MSLNEIIKLAEKFERKIFSQQNLINKAPVTLNWNRNQILELQKLINKINKSFGYGVSLIKEDGIYGPETRNAVAGGMQGANLNTIDQLFNWLKSKG